MTEIEEDKPAATFAVGDEVNYVPHQCHAFQRCTRSGETQHGPQRGSSRRWCPL